jgi:hypothetical protein
MHPDVRRIGARCPRAAPRAPTGLGAVEPTSRREGRATRLDLLADFAHLHLHFVAQLQWRDAVIRPRILCADRSATARAQETGTPPATVGKLKRRFEPQGL